MKVDRQLQDRLSDLELVSLVKRGDASAFATLSDRYMPVLLGRAGRYAGIVGVDVEDFLQEGMFALFRAVKGFNPEAEVRFSTYAVTCIHNSMTDAIRAHMKCKRHDGDVNIEDIDRQPHASFSAQLQQKPVEDILLEQEARSIRENQIKTLLSDFEQHVLKLYLSGHSYRHISLVLSSTVKSVDNALQRVRRKLRQTT